MYENLSYKILELNGFVIGVYEGKWKEDRFVGRSFSNGEVRS